MHLRKFHKGIFLHISSKNGRKWTFIYFFVSVCNWSFCLWNRISRHASDLSETPCVHLAVLKNDKNLPVFAFQSCMLLHPTQKGTLCLNMLNGTIYSLIHEPSLPNLQYADFGATSKQSKKAQVSHVSESTIVTHRKVFSEHTIYYFKLPVLLYMFLMRHDKYRIFTTLHITRFQVFLYALDIWFQCFAFQFLFLIIKYIHFKDLLV